MRPPASAHVPTTADAILVVGAEAVPKTAPRPSAPVVVATAEETEKAETAAAEKAKAATATATAQSMAVAAKAAAEKAATDAAAKAAVAKAAAEKAAAGKAAAEKAARDMAAAEKDRFTNVLRVCLPAAAAGDGAADAAGGASGAQDSASCAQDGASCAQDGGTAKLAALQLTIRSLSGEMRSEMQALDQRPSEVIKSCSGEIRSEMQALSQTVDELRSALARLELTCQVTFGEERLGERLLDGEQLANSLRECLHLRSQRDPSAAAIRPQSGR